MKNTGSKPITKPHENKSTQDIALLASGALVSLLSKLIGRAAHMLGQIFLARYLGPEIFGLYTIGWTILRMFGLFTPLGLEKGVVHFGSQHWKSRQLAWQLNNIVQKSLLTATVSGLLAGVLLYLLAPWLAASVFVKPELEFILKIFAFGFPFLSILRVASSATRISQKMNYSAISEDLSQPIVNLILFGLAFAFGLSLNYFVAGTVVSFIFAVVLAIYFTISLFRKNVEAPIPIDINLTHLLAFSIPAAFTGVFVTLIMWVDRLFIGFFLPTEELGIYQAVSLISVVFSIVLTAFNSIFSPMISDLFHKNELVRLQELYRINTKWGIYICLPVFLIIYFAPLPLVNIVFGADYSVGVTVLLILSIGQVINLASGSVGYLLIMTGHQNIWFFITGIAFSINLLLNWLWIPIWGNIGAAIATSVSTGGVFIVGLITVRILLGLTPYDKRYLKGVAALGITIVFLTIFRIMFSVSTFVEFGTVIFISFFSFFCALYLLGLDMEDKAFLNIILKKVGYQN